MESYLGGISLVGFNFAPVGCALCNGQLLPISQNTAVFSLLGTFYGGDGTTTFALPDLRGRIPIHQGQGPGLSPYVIGQTGGSETVTLITTQIPAHSHLVNVNNSPGTTATPTGNYLASGPPTGSGPNASLINTYAAADASNVNLNAGTIATTGGSQPHANIQPYLCVSYIIALQGVFPSRN